MNHRSTITQNMAFVFQEAISGFSTKQKKIDSDFMGIFHSMIDMGVPFDWQFFLDKNKDFSQPSFLHFVFKYETNNDYLLKWFENFKKQETLWDQSPFDIKVKNYKLDKDDISLVGLALRYKQTEIDKCAFKSNIKNLKNKQEKSQSQAKKHIKIFLDKVYLSSEINIDNKNPPAPRKRRKM